MINLIEYYLSSERHKWTFDNKNKIIFWKENNAEIRIDTVPSIYFLNHLIMIIRMKKK